MPPDVPKELKTDHQKKKKEAWLVNNYRRKLTPSGETQQCTVLVASSLSCCIKLSKMRNKTRAQMISIIGKIPKSRPQSDGQILFPPCCSKHWFFYFWAKKTYFQVMILVRTDPKRLPRIPVDAPASRHGLNQSCIGNEKNDVHDRSNDHAAASVYSHEVWRNEKLHLCFLVGATVGACTVYSWDRFMFAPFPRLFIYPTRSYRVCMHQKQRMNVILFRKGRCCRRRCCCCFLHARFENRAGVDFSVLLFFMTSESHRLEMEMRDSTATESNPKKAKAAQQYCKTK